MKIALPTREEIIDSHFGHCEYFTVYTIEDQIIINKEIVPSPVGCGCKSDIASVLAQQGVTLMLAGNMGDGAVNVLQAAGIKVIRGCSGSIDSNITDWMNDELKDSGEICHEHECDH